MQGKGSIKQKVKDKEVNLILALLRSLLKNNRRFVFVPGLTAALMLLLFQKKVRVQISQRV